MKQNIYFFLIIIFSILFSSVVLNGQEDFWRTVMYSDEEFTYFLGKVEPPYDWNTIEFNDNEWLKGKGGIGYGDGDDNTIIPKVVSLYMRYEFKVSDISTINKMIMHADYDDGFVAYLNGHEIARSNIIGFPPTFDTEATILREALMYEDGLPEIFLVQNFEDLIVEGNNVLSFQTHNFDGIASSDLTTLFWMSMKFSNPTSKYGDIPEWFSNTLFETKLPIMIINTGNVNIEDEPEIPGFMEIIYAGSDKLNSIIDDPNEYAGHISIEKRGQSSLYLFPKNGYGIETKDENGDDIDVGFLGMPPEEDWVLHGPYSDKTLIRNVLAMHLASQLDQYASRSELIELFINGQYEGVYVLQEKIKRNEFRVDISKLKEEDVSGDELSGGYIFKLDKGSTDWSSNHDIINNPGNKLSFQYVYPRREKIQPEQATYIKSFVDSFELAMLVPNGNYGGKSYDEYIDLSSFVDHFLISEFTKNVDAYRISSYFHKHKDSKGGLINAGPVWDFNLAFGNASYCTCETPYGWIYYEHCDNGNPFWWDKMMADPKFANAANCRWKELRNEKFILKDIEDFIDEKANYLKDAAERNFTRWPVLGEVVWPNPVVWGYTFEEEISYLKQFIKNRLRWMDESMIGSCTSNINLIENVNSLNIYPNPNNGIISIVADNEIKVNKISVFNSYSISVNAYNYDSSLDLSHLPNGMYFLRFQTNKGIVIRKFIKTD